ncbi:MAG: beta-ketoacyl-ACP synthase II [Pirellulaceae bacterium]
MRRVVVTGIGIVAPTGNTTQQAWQSAIEGRSAITRITLFDPSGLPVQIAGEVKDLDVSPVMDAKIARQSTRYIQLAAVAAREAILDSGLDAAAESERFGCSIGTGIGGIELIDAQLRRFADQGPHRVSPLLVPYSINNMAAGFVAIRETLRGPNFCVTTACASGTHAIGEAFLHIVGGTTDMMLAGGSEASIIPLIVAGFANMRALSPNDADPAGASRPFDLHRDGFVIGEGCGLLVLEEYEHALRRDAPIYAEMVGYGLSADAYHITGPPEDGAGAARALVGCLASGSIARDEVDYINAHGTSTQANDASETAAIKTVFGTHARRLAISSTKGVTGHCLGAAGGIEAAYTVLALARGLVPPTANLTTPDPVCDLDYVPGPAREMSIRYALSNSFGFGGQNACIAFRRFPSEARKNG